MYPSLTKQESADEVAKAVIESSLKWEGVSWKEATRFLVLGRDETWCRTSKLWRVLPRRRHKKGTKPGLTGVQPLGADDDREERQWDFREGIELTEIEKKTAVAEVMRLAVEIMFSTHLYSFGGRCYKQKEGGPIGLRSTCALARVVMGRWDSKWNERAKQNNLIVEDDGRYVDDARVYLYPVRAGWRWEAGGLWFKKEWEEEDALLSPTERTKRVVYASMQGLTKCLAFTAETCEDFADGWLPTLDFKIRVNGDNIIEYSFFEKPTASNRCLQADTALNQNCLIRSLSNEVMRRLDSFSNTVSQEERVREMDKFSKKMVNSGHSIKTTRSVLISGMKGFKRRVARAKEKNMPLHRSAGQSAAARRTKKLLAKTNWFRQPAGEEDERAPQGEEDQSERVSGRGVNVSGPNQERSSVNAQTASQRNIVNNSARERKDNINISSKLRTTTVLFVEFSKGGSIQKSMRETLDRLAPMLQFKVRVAEKGGTALGSLLSNKNPWSGQECGREACRTCAQPEERKEACTQRNIVYESECARCNPPGARRAADKEGLEERVR